MCRQIQYSFVDNTLGYQPSLVTFIERKKKKNQRRGEFANQHINFPFIITDFPPGMSFGLSETNSFG
jgi:hypothetical protein